MVTVNVTQDDWWASIVVPLGAVLLGISAGLIARWWLDPWFGRRERRQMRWDSYAVDLGTLMIGEFVQAGSGWQGAATNLRTAVLEHASGRITEEELGLAADAYQHAFSAMYGLGMRITWLAERLQLGGGAPSGSLIDLDRAVARWDAAFWNVLHSVELERVSEGSVRLGKVADYEEISKIGTELRDAGTDLNAVVAAVSDGKRRVPEILFEPPPVQS